MIIYYFPQATPLISLKTLILEEQNSNANLCRTPDYIKEYIIA